LTLVDGEHAIDVVFAVLIDCVYYLYTHDVDPAFN